MKTVLKSIHIETKKQFELVDITERVRSALSESTLREGIAAISCPHTTASIRLNHNEPLLLQDFMKALYNLVPVDTGYSHDLFELRQNVAANERSNGHAHVKALLLGSSETILVTKGMLLLGDKQSIFFIELDGGRSRKIHVQFLGE